MLVQHLQIELIRPPVLVRVGPTPLWRRDGIAGFSLSLVLAVSSFGSVMSASAPVGCPDEAVLISLASPPLSDSWSSSAVDGCVNRLAAGVLVLDHAGR
jgi:hypothetical protein